MSNQAKADVLFLLTSDCLAVANQGDPFTREGLRAICGTHLSSKPESYATPIKDKGDADKLLREIRKKRLDTYKIDSSYIKEHGRAEDAFRNEYRGRILLEILQNAHDAAASRQIGAKGVGFKAVLNVCKGVRIYSGPLHCCFDYERSREELNGVGLIRNSEPVPLMRLPFVAREADEPEYIRDLVGRYDTVIVLSLIDRSAHDSLLKEWQACSDDDTLLLFLPGLDRITWEYRNGSKSDSKSWSLERQDDIVRVYNDKNMGSALRWHVSWSESERAAVAFQLTDDDTLKPRWDYPNLRAFFKTEERSPLPVLLHADFPLKVGRDHVLTEGESNSDHVDQIIKELANVMRSALTRVSDAGLLIDLLSPRIDPEQMGTLKMRIWREVREGVVDLNVPGTTDLKLGSVRLRPSKESLPASWWFSCALWNTFKQVLSDHRTGQLSGLPLFPPGVETDKREETILYINPSASLSKEELQKLPLLPVGGRDVPVPSDETNIFMSLEKIPASAPAGIDVWFLKEGFVHAIEEHPAHDNLRRIVSDLLGVSEFKPQSLIDRVILPVLRTEGQPDGLIDFLYRVIEPALSSDNLIFDWRDPVRRELAERLRVPLRNGGLLPAAQVYAGEEWTGNDFLDRMYLNRTDRGFLAPPPEDLKKQECWGRFYRYVGVSWCPKVLPVVCFEDKELTRKGPRWEQGIFPVEHPPEYWCEYCGSLDDFEMEPRKARLRQNWTLDGGTDVLLQDNAFAVVNSNWQYYSKYCDAVIYRSSNRQYDNDNRKPKCPSYLAYLLRTSVWVPVKGVEVKQRPEDVFLRSEIIQGLGGFAYELDGSADDDFLKKVGVRSGWRQVTNEDWCRWLQQATEYSKETLNQSHKLQNAIYRLYEAALLHWADQDRHSTDSATRWHKDIWSIERYADNTEFWRLSHERDRIYYVDRPELEELRLPGIQLFPVRLARLETAAQKRFGLRLLSKCLQGTPHKARVVDDAANRVKQRMKDRLKIVNAYFQVAGSESPAKVEEADLPDVSVVDSLQVRFRLRDQVLEDGMKLDRYHSHTDNGYTLWLDVTCFDKEKRPTPSVWEYVASALVHAADLSLDKQPVLKDLLLYEGDPLRRKLLMLGVTEQTVEKVTSGSLPTSEPVREPSPAPEPRDPPDPVPRFPDDGGRPGGIGSEADGTLPPRNPNAGQQAQEWLRGKLKEQLECEGWRVSDKPTYDEKQRETDIELHSDRYGSFHVEVKHCESGIIYWSENEVRKAQSNPTRYAIAILIRSQGEDFRQYWIRDPLQKLAELPRKGVWEWKGRKEGVGLNAGEASWDVPVPKPTRPANFTFKIEVKDMWLDQHALTFDEINSEILSLGKIH